MVFVLYKVKHSRVDIIGVYENKDAATYDQKNFQDNVSLEDLDLVKYYVSETYIHKHIEEPPMKFSEEDNDIEEEDYYELQKKCKGQDEEIIILKDELNNMKLKYKSIINDYVNDTYFNFTIIAISTIMLFVTIMVYLL